ncbi:MAG: TetR/AcrR family transcriptional regulator [Gemmatimonadota bacterium]|jgi:AcrR family transcriptional regulator
MTRTLLAARDRIVEAAATVWAADPSATLDVVAQRAGVGRATLHRHFPSRAALIRTAALEGIAALAAALDAAALGQRRPAEALDALINILVPFGDRLHFLLVTGELIDDPDLAAAEAAVNGSIRQLLDSAAAAGVLRNDLPAAWRFRALEALLYAAWTAVAVGEIARLDAPELVRDTLRRGFGPSPASPAAR